MFSSDFVRNCLEIFLEKTKIRNKMSMQSVEGLRSEIMKNIQILFLFF